jgi:hypothetical protein
MREFHSDMAFLLMFLAFLTLLAWECLAVRFGLNREKPG